jgi:hypothetical protein
VAILSAQNGEVVLKDLNSFYALNMYNVWIYFNRIFLVLTMVRLVWVLVHPRVVAAPWFYPFIGHKCASWPTFHFECGWVLLSLFSYLIWTITIVIASFIVWSFTTFDIVLKVGLASNYIDVFKEEPMLP